jgi:DNA-binding MarR family transcriptional regulator
MSRIVRSLEDSRFVTCDINPQDKRKIDVTITDSGRLSYEKFRKSKLQSILDALERLTEEERMQFMELLRKMTGVPS